MKKLSAFVLTLIFVISLSACTANKDMDGENGNANSSSSYNQSSDASSTPAPQYTAPQSGNQSDVNTAQISKDEALDIALKYFSLKKENVRDIEVELDKERKGTVWEVDFKSGNKEYSVDVNSNTGAVIKAENEIED